jgi:hypothetical protein
VRGVRRGLIGLTDRTVSDLSHLDRMHVIGSQSKLT